MDSLDLNGLNSAQREAVMHGEGPMLVLAGPGSGKTFTVTARISYLIEHFGVSPGQILVITFTKEAALNMQKRFTAMQGRSVPVCFGTFHAVFFQMIRRSGYCKCDRILKDAEKKRLLYPVLLDYVKGSEVKMREEVYEDTVSCLEAIGLFKNTLDMKMAKDLLREPYRSGFEQIMGAYEEKRKADGGLDFDDMLSLCLSMFKNRGDILEMWQKRFGFFLIDEVQDINPMQYEIVKLLAGERGNLFVVGDDDQSIYGFRGAAPFLMRRFTEDFAGCRQVLLNMNYRSRSEIVEASLKVIGENRDRFSKNLRAVRSAKDKENVRAVTVKSFTDKNEQYRYMTSLFLGKESDELYNFAVLFRTNSMMQGFATCLMKAGVPYIMKEGGGCIYDHFIVRDVDYYIRFAAGERSRKLFLVIMNRPSRWINREALEDEEVDFDRLRAYYRKYALPGDEGRMIKAITELEKNLDRIGRMPPWMGVNYLRRSMGYEGYLRSKAGTDKEKFNEWTQMLDFLCEEARQFDTYKEWMDYQELFRENFTDREKEKDTGTGLHLMTIHASKGLEFDRVWIPDLNEGIYPHGRSEDEACLEEERRIFYVGMTRAKDALELLYLTGTKEHPRIPSRFLDPLLPKFKDRS